MRTIQLTVGAATVLALASCSGAPTASTVIPSSTVSSSADGRPTETAPAQTATSASILPPNGTWQVALTAAELTAAGWPADITPAGTYTWTFTGGRAVLEVDGDDGTESHCEAAMEPAGEGFRLTYDDGECGGEVDEIEWRLDDAGLHLAVISTNAPLDQQKAYLETEPWQAVAPEAPSVTAAPGRLAEFREARDAICRPGSEDIADINETMGDMTPQQTAEALGRIVARIEAAQKDLDKLPVPPEASGFVAADNLRRQKRIDLVTRLAAALVTDPDAVDSIDAELNTLNIETEAEEDRLQLAHCP